MDGTNPQREPLVDDNQEEEKIDEQMRQDETPNNYRKRKRYAKVVQPKEDDTGKGLAAEAIPHLALFISLVGAFASSALALIFPPIIELLCAYSQKSLSRKVWTRSIFLLMFGIFGFATGTYASLVQIFEAFAAGTHDI